MWLLLGLAVAVGLYGWRKREEARLRRLWLERMHGARNGTFGLGISALVADGVDEERLARLLGVEYDHFEVVAVVDGERDALLVERLMARYHLIRVAWHPSGELSVREVQGLYRSRKRRFRRLVVVDCRAEQRILRLNAAADVASYDYLMPLVEGREPLKGAVERLVTELALRPLDSVDQICLLPTFTTLVWRRTALVRVGGFVCRPLTVVSPPHRILRWESPLTTGCRRGLRMRWSVAAVVLVLSVAEGVMAGQWQPPVAALATLGWFALLALRLRQLTAELQPL